MRTHKTPPAELATCGTHSGTRAPRLIEHEQHDTQARAQQVHNTQHTAPQQHTPPRQLARPTKPRVRVREGSKGTCVRMHACVSGAGASSRHRCLKPAPDGTLTGSAGWTAAHRSPGCRLRRLRDAARAARRADGCSRQSAQPPRSWSGARGLRCSFGACMLCLYVRTRVRTWTHMQACIHTQCMHNPRGSAHTHTHACTYRCLTFCGN